MGFDRAIRVGTQRVESVRAIENKIKKGNHRGQSWRGGAIRWDLGGQSDRAIREDIL